MNDRLRFHLDEHIDPDIAEALRRHGIDATTTAEVGLRAAQHQPPQQRNGDRDGDSSLSLVRYSDCRARFSETRSFITG